LGGKVSLDRNGACCYRPLGADGSCGGKATIVDITGTGPAASLHLKYSYFLIPNLFLHPYQIVHFILPRPKSD
jgi:hypothetical protein